MTKGNNIVKLDLPAHPHYGAILSSVIETYLDRVPNIADREITIYNLKLAATECYTNFIRPSYVDEVGWCIKVCLTVQYDPRRLVVELHDTGKSVDPVTLAEPHLRVGSEPGYGLFLVHVLMDEVNYSQDESGNHWRLVKNI